MARSYVKKITGTQLSKIRSLAGGGKHNYPKNRKPATFTKPFIPHNKGKTAKLSALQREISRNVYGKVISPKDKGFANKRSRINQIARQKPTPVPDYTKIPWSNKTTFGGGLTKSDLAVMRYNGVKKTGVDLAAWGHTWKRDHKGRYYLGFSGPKSKQHKTMKVDWKMYIKPKRVR